MVELEAWCFKGAEEFVLLFYRLFWKDLGELVSMIKCNLGSSMGTLYELCESRLCRWNGAKISRE
jgi:hypothetical protein